MEVIRDLDIVRAVPPSALLRAEDGPANSMPTMTVRFSQFDTWYEIDSVWEGRFLERTVKGAFKKTISENRQNVKVLFDHGYDPSVGNKVLGAIESLSEGPDGPVGEVPLFDTSYNRDLLPGLEAGVYGSSFRFRVIRDEWNDDPGRSEYNPDGIPERTIKEVRLFEFGPVTFPANPDSTAGVRSQTDIYYEHLRSREPQKVADLYERARSLRTLPTLDGSAASIPNLAPVDATRGLSASARERILALPFLTEGNK
ncbi:HK97 family phage prohead protease [Nonomuraea wenchangensis]|nr:HK97 family phage prohead protease [Nonomuraea wenchangensis]